MTLVEKLVHHYSPSGQEKNAVAVLLEELQLRGFKTQADQGGNAIGVIGNGPIRIYLVGHIDTVPGEIPVKVENNILYGRGSVDAKASLASFVEAASAFQDSEVLTISVIGCIAEETDSKGARYIFDTLASPQYTIIGEPSGWSGITLGYRGSLPLQYKLEIPNSHFSGAKLTAAEQALSFYRKLKESYPNQSAQFDCVGFALTDINTHSNGSHNNVSMNVDIRTPVDFESQMFEQTVTNIQGQAIVKLGQYLPAVLADKRNPLVRAISSGIRRQGSVPVFKKKTGTSDMNILCAWNCPIIAYGPGDSTFDHTPDEQLDLSEYQNAIRVLKHCLARLEADHATI